MEHIMYNYGKKGLHTKPDKPETKVITQGGLNAKIPHYKRVMVGSLVIGLWLHLDKSQSFPLKLLIIFVHLR